MTSTYNASLHCLDELPGMEKPHHYNYPAGLTHKQAEELYQQHLASLRKGIPVDESARGMWGDKATLTEGKDYEIREELWRPETEEEYQELQAELKYETDHKIRKVLRAFPITGQGEEELWDSAIEIYHRHIFTGHKNAIAEVKSKYSITKK